MFRDRLINGFKACEKRNLTLTTWPWNLDEKELFKRVDVSQIGIIAQLHFEYDNIEPPCNWPEVASDVISSVQDVGAQSRHVTNNNNNNNRIFYSAVKSIDTEALERLHNWAELTNSYRRQV